MVKLRPGSDEEYVELFLTFDDRWHADETLEQGWATLMAPRAKLETSKVSEGLYIYF
jgi:hypothetical protein